MRRSCTVKDAQTFLDEAMQAAVQEESTAPGGLVATKRDSEKVMSFSAGLPAAEGGVAGFGGGLHSSGYSK
jgi:hypothetical protein